MGIKKEKKRERRSMMLSLLQLIGSGYESSNYEDFNRNDLKPSFFESVMIRWKSLSRFPRAPKSRN